MTPRREIGFLRSLLGQEEESEEQNESVPTRHPGAELADIAQSGYDDDATDTGWTSAESGQSVPSTPPPATETQEAGVPGITVTQTEAGTGDILETASEVPSPQIADHDVEVPEAPSVIHTESAVESPFEVASEVPAQVPAQAPAQAPAAQAAPAQPAFDPLQTAVSQLKSPDVERRREALRSLSVLEMTPAAFAAVAGALQDPEHDVRSLALRVLERDPTHAPLDAISGAALDADPGIRARAMALLGRSGNVTVLPSLVDRIGGEEDEAVIGAALGGVARLLGSIDPSRLAQHTAENVSRSVAGLSPVVRARFRREVGLIASGLPEAWIADALNSSDNVLKRGMAILATERGSGHALNALAALSGDDDPEVRELANDAQSHATIIDAPVVTSPFSAGVETNGFDDELEQVTIPVLMTALKDPQPAVRERAEAALRAIKPARIASWLVPQIVASDPDDAAHLAEIALRLNIAEAVPALVDHVLELELGDRSGEVVGGSSWLHRYPRANRYVAVRHGPGASHRGDQVGRTRGAHRYGGALTPDSRTRAQPSA